MEDQTKGCVAGAGSTEYELQREAKIARNNEHLRALGLLVVPQQVVPDCQKRSRVRSEKPQTQTNSAEPRRCARLTSVPFQVYAEMPNPEQLPVVAPP